MIERKFTARNQRETKISNVVVSLFILAKVAAKWQLLTLLFRKSEGESKLQICNFSRYFSCKRKKFSRKCNCIHGRNFKLCRARDDSKHGCYRSMRLLFRIHYTQAFRVNVSFLSFVDRRKIPRLLKCSAPVIRNTGGYH